MILDIRLKTTWVDHWKTELLAQRCGDSAPRCLLRLWSWARVHRPDGLLRGMAEEAVELQAGWRGDRGHFAAALLDIPWIDRTPEGLYLHDWHEHEAWAVGSSARAEAARRAGAASAIARRGIIVEATPGQRHVDGPSTDRQRGVNGPSTPSPSPSPSPNTEEKIPPMAPPQGGTAPEKGPEAPRPRRPRSKPGAAQTGRWAEEIAEAIRLWHAAEKAHGQTWKLGGAVEECLARYLERAGSAEKALAALRRLADHPPRQWYLDGPWSLAWLAKSTDSNRQPVDRFQELLDGRFDEPSEAPPSDLARAHAQIERLRAMGRKEAAGGHQQ